MSISLFNGISGLTAHQKMLNVIAHNISNLNTHGFKKSSVRFTEHRSLTLQPASAPVATRGGTNPVQLGYGVHAGHMAFDFSQGTLDSTGRSLDMTIQGEGFFVLDDGNSLSHFTRVGNFGLDSDDFLVDQATGYRVLSPDGPIYIPRNETIAPTETSEVVIKGNLSPDTAIGGDPIVTSIKVVDSQGDLHNVEFSFVKTGAQTWNMTAALPDGDGVLTDTLVEDITFDTSGAFVSAGTAGAGDNNIELTFTGLGAQTISFDFGTANGYDGLISVGGDTSVAAATQNGYEAGSLTSLSVKQDGTIVGHYNNGELQDLSQIVVATFGNPEGLEKTSTNLYISSMNSGEPVFGKGLSGRAGSIISGSLESSNVDVSTEIAQMIIAQRGFQVNARVITVSNDVLEEVTNLTR